MRAWIRDTERLSSITAEPSPRPMVQDCPAFSGKRRPAQSNKRKASGSAGITDLQCSK
jgi:hypothetical protein